MTSSTEPTFFIDWCLGRTVEEALRASGASVIHHREFFEPGTPDIEWLPIVGLKGWVVLTKDNNISKNQLELMAIASANVMVFILASGNLTSQEMAGLYVDVLEKLKRFVQGNQAPFIAKVFKDRRVERWKNSTQLLRLLRSN
ncbi:MAG TPA: DUF5615 family PIN-like protein [Stenomitos sp.]